ncbi:helix-turn-helix transcriptional regulator [Herbiconiux sp. VKM Ac-2851]|uniref:AraC family transcriptional regulator n=1 Tax=Herbiconiux sp. VKM Ac-2851 TaxID=2739025 RepID=UPI0015671FE3|nr:helix-turn-helix transcriptional regulator [Herbiconiux sp. VKM Ac-2851]NQX34559.1 helix-turn-helix domain-containing protein [Herbiconiux sp. VKM Ac-2851]
MDGEPRALIRTESSGTELDDARAMYQDGYNGTGFRAELSDEEFSYRYTVAGGPDMTLRSSTFLGSITGTIQPENAYIVSWLLGGRGTMDVGHDEVTLMHGVPAMFPTGKPYAFDFADYRQNLVHFDAGFLERVAAEHEGLLPGPIHFASGVLPSPDALRRWNASVDEAARLIIRGEPTPLQLAEIDRRTAVALLDAFAHEGSGMPTVLLAPRNVRLRRAVERMHASAHLPIAPFEVAEEVGLTPRGLQQAFARQLGVTPTEYLRAIRLDRVQAELQQLGPDETTVAQVAARWGFTHAGRFSRSYAARFGEYPRNTLLR